MTRQDTNPATPPTLLNFLENTLIPCTFRCAGGVAGVSQFSLRVAQATLSTY